MLNSWRALSALFLLTTETTGKIFQRQLCYGRWNQTQVRFSHANCTYSERQLPSLLTNSFAISLVACTHSDFTQLAIFRSYVNPSKISHQVFDQCMIWQACRATSTAPTFFPPVTIGNQQFLNRGVRTHDPVKIMRSEAKDVWPTRADDAVLVNLGTGNAPSGAFGGNVFQIVKKLTEIATETEDTARTFLEGSGRVMAQNGGYYHFTITMLKST